MFYPLFARKRLRVYVMDVSLILSLGLFLLSCSAIGNLPHPIKDRGTDLADAMPTSNSSLSAGVLPASGPAGFSADWTTYGYDVQRTGYNPLETRLGIGNVPDLRELWSFDLGAVTNTSPIFASTVRLSTGFADVVYMGTENGDVIAVDAQSGQQVWRRNLGRQVLSFCQDLPGGVYGVTGSPVLDRDRNALYVAGGDGNVYALAMDTGAIQSGWPVRITDDPAHEHVYSAATLWKGRLYVALAGNCDRKPYHGRLVSISVATAQIAATWYPVSDLQIFGGGIWGAGGVSVDPVNDDVYVATGNAKTKPENVGYSDQVVRLTADLQVVAADNPGISGGDVDFGTTPVLFQNPGCPAQTVAENKTGALLLYNRDTMANGSLQTIQISDSANIFIGLPAYSPITHMLYVASPYDANSGLYRHGLVALQQQPNCRLGLAWQQTVDPEGVLASSPTVANNVVYYGNGSGHTLHALNAVSGDKLWDSGATIGAEIYAPPIVVNGRLYAGAWDHKLHAFGPK